MFIDFREREEKRDRNISPLSSTRTPPQGLNLQTLVYETTFQPTEPPCQGWTCFFEEILLTIHHIQKI